MIDQVMVYQSMIAMPEIIVKCIDGATAKTQNICSLLIYKPSIVLPSVGSKLYLANVYWAPRHSAQ